MSITFDTTPITILFPISAKLNGFRPCLCQEQIPASHRNQVPYWAV